MLIPSTESRSLSNYVWEDLSVNLPDARLRDFLVHPDHPNQIYVLTQKGVWKTEDRGKSWELLFSVQNKRYVSEERVKEKSNRVLFRFLKESDQDKVVFNKDLLSNQENFVFLEKNFLGGTVLKMDPYDSNNIYVGTFNGLVLSTDQGKTWRSYSVGVGGAKNVVLDLLVSQHDPNRIYVGTLGGLFVSNNRGKKWNSLKFKMGSEAIESILENPSDSKQLWLSVLGKGVLTTENRGKSWKESSLGIGDAVNQVFSLALLKNQLYAVTAQGLYCLDQKSEDWIPCDRQGALEAGLKNMITLEGEEAQIFLSGKRGLFYSQDIGRPFQQIAAGVRFQNAEQIEVRHDQVYFLSSRGLFSSPLNQETKGFSFIKNLVRYRAFLKQEPSIQETQQKAMRFAQTHPEKIKEWQRGAKWRALMPKLQIGFDEERVRQRDFDSSASRDFSSSEELTLDEEVITAVSFKEKRQIPVSTFEERRSFDERFDFSGASFRERETDFVVGAVWELGDLLYNPDEIGISKEARALAELRDDLLKEVTQTYFRRRHLQIDLFIDQEELKSAEIGLKEKMQLAQKQFRMQLELEELSAQLDALTGGWFSKQIETKETNLVEY